MWPSNLIPHIFILLYFKSFMELCMWGYYHLYKQEVEGELDISHMNVDI